MAKKAMEERAVPRHTYKRVLVARRGGGKRGGLPEDKGLQALCRRERQGDRREGTEETTRLASMLWCSVVAYSSLFALPLFAPAHTLLSVLVTEHHPTTRELYWSILWLCMTVHFLLIHMALFDFS